MNVCKSDSGLKKFLILLVVFSFSLYLPSLFHEAFADDDVYLAFANHFLRETDWSDLYQFFLRPANPIEFLPLRDLTYWLDFRLFGDELSGFHATNLIWYAACGLAAFWLFHELILLLNPPWVGRATVLSLCGTIVFFAHPAHVEVVAWISSRKDLVAATLGFLSQAMLVRALRCQWPWRGMLFAAMLLFFSCFGKATGMTGILFSTVLICAGWNLQSEIGQIKKLTILFMFWALVAFAFLIHLKVGEVTGIRMENYPGWFQMLDRASRIFTALIGILLFPYPLHFYYDVYQIGNWHWLISVTGLLSLIVSIWILWHRRSLWALGIVLAFSPMLIYLQFIPFTTWSMASERFVFVPVAGLSLVLIDLFGRLSNPMEITRLLLAIVLPCSAIVWLRLAEWGDFPNYLLFREYDMQPGFHNAIRDRIVFRLLPEGRFAEAEVLALRIDRTYVSEALVALVRTEQAYLQMKASALSNSDAEEVKQCFCEVASKLEGARRNAYVYIQKEPDVSYNNILRTIDARLKFSYGYESNCMSTQRLQL